MIRAIARVVFVMVPPLLLASALFAAPKGAKAPPAKKPPLTKNKDAGPDSAEVSTAPTEKVADAGVAPKSSSPKGEGGELLKETEKKEGDAAVKVFEFGTTEIEGRARWPAVTYFVRRMRAEFEAQRLPHRPFLPELESTKGDPAVK